MALTVDSSGDPGDFWPQWLHIHGMVRREWLGVLRECGPKPPGFYEVKVELMWDIEEPLEEA
jgi:hypothetical protein